MKKIKNKKKVKQTKTKLSWTKTWIRKISLAVSCFMLVSSLHLGTIPRAYAWDAPESTKNELPPLPSVDRSLRLQEGSAATQPQTIPTGRTAVTPDPYDCFGDGVNNTIPVPGRNEHVVLPPSNYYSGSWQIPNNMKFNPNSGLDTRGAPLYNRPKGSQIELVPTSSLYLNNSQLDLYGPLSISGQGRLDAFGSTFHKHRPQANLYIGAGLSGTFQNNYFNKVNLIDRGSRIHYIKNNFNDVWAYGSSFENAYGNTFRGIVRAYGNSFRGAYDNTFRGRVFAYGDSFRGTYGNTFMSRVDAYGTSFAGANNNIFQKMVIARGNSFKEAYGNQFQGIVKAYDNSFELARDNTFKDRVYAYNASFAKANNNAFQKMVIAKNNSFREAFGNQFKTPVKALDNSFKDAFGNQGKALLGQRPINDPQKQLEKNLLRAKSLTSEVPKLTVDSINVSKGLKKAAMPVLPLPKIASDADLYADITRSALDGEQLVMAEAELTQQPQDKISPQIKTWMISNGERVPVPGQEVTIDNGKWETALTPEGKLTFTFKAINPNHDMEGKTANWVEPGKTYEQDKVIYQVEPNGTTKPVALKVTGKNGEETVAIGETYTDTMGITRKVSLSGSGKIDSLPVEGSSTTGLGSTAYEKQIKWVVEGGKLVIAKSQEPIPIGNSKWLPQLKDGKIDYVFDSLNVNPEKNSAGKPLTSKWVKQNQKYFVKAGQNPDIGEIEEVRKVILSPDGANASTEFVGYRLKSWTEKTENGKTILENYAPLEKKSGETFIDSKGVKREVNVLKEGGATFNPVDGWIIPTVPSLSPTPKPTPPPVTPPAKPATPVAKPVTPPPAKPVAKPATPVAKPVTPPPATPKAGDTTFSPYRFAPIGGTPIPISKIDSLRSLADKIS